MLKLEKYSNIGGFNEEKNINIVKLVIDILKKKLLIMTNIKKF